MAFERDYLLHAVRGGLDIQVGRRRWLLPPSFAAWLPAHTEFTAHLKRPVTSCSILTTPGFCARMPNRAAAFQMTRLTREMASYSRRWGQEDNHPSEAGVFFQALLATCAPLIDSSPDVARPASCDQRLAAALDYSEARLSDPVEEREVARAAGVSVRTLQRKFAQEFGLSWSEIMTRIRMIRAVELLSEGTLKVAAIAMECGYSSLSAFNRAFLAYSGSTPTEFRKALEV